MNDKQIIDKLAKACKEHGGEFLNNPSLKSYTCQITSDEENIKINYDKGYGGNLSIYRHIGYHPTLDKNYTRYVGTYINIPKEIIENISSDEDDNLLVETQYGTALITQNDEIGIHFERYQK